MRGQHELLYRRRLTNKIGDVYQCGGLRFWQNEGVENRVFENAGRFPNKIGTVHQEVTNEIGPIYSESCGGSLSTTGVLVASEEVYYGLLANEIGAVHQEVTNKIGSTCGLSRVQWLRLGCGHGLAKADMFTCREGGVTAVVIAVVKSSPSTLGLLTIRIEAVHQRLRMRSDLPSRCEVLRVENSARMLCLSSECRSAHRLARSSARGFGVYSLLGRFSNEIGTVHQGSRIGSDLWIDLLREGLKDQMQGVILVWVFLRGRSLMNAGLRVSRQESDC